MIVAFDTGILIYVIDEQAKPPIDSATGKTVEPRRERERPAWRRRLCPESR